MPIMSVFLSAAGQLSRETMRRPGWTLAVVGLLGLAIGVNLAVFAVVDAVLFQPLAVQEVNSLVRIFSNDETGHNRSNASYPFLHDLTTGAASLHGMAAYSTLNSVHLRVGDAAPARATATMVSGGYFDLLGVRPAAGRLLNAADDSGDAAIAVASEAFFRDALGGDPASIGRRVTVNGTPVVVVGVLPRGFHGIDLERPADLWLPLAASPFVNVGMGGFRSLTQRGFQWLDAVARLAPGASLTAAQAELEARARNLRAQQPRDQRDPLPELIPAALASVDAYGTEQTRRIAWTLSLGVGLILLVTCGNVAGLVLVRLEERRRELAVKLGLGASALRLAAELLAGLAFLGVMGAVVGQLLADSLLRLFARLDLAEFLVPASLVDEVQAPRVLLVSLCFALASVLCAALVPLRRGMRIDPGSELKSQGSQTLVAGGDRVRLLLVAGQSALAVMLIAGGGVLLRSFLNVSAVDPGFRTGGVAVARVDTALQGYDAARRAGFRDAVLAQLRARGDVDASAMANLIPVQSGSMSQSIATQPPRDRTELTEHAYFNSVSEGFFAAMSIPFQAGRDFEPGDAGEGKPARIIVNAALAARYFPGSSALGKYLYTSKEPMEIIGVVANTKLTRLELDDEPAFFRPLAKSDFGFYSIVARARSGDPNAALAAIEETVRAQDPALPIYGARALESQVSAALAKPRLLALAATVLALVATVLCLAGLYALIAHAVRTRVREIGLRVALGAQRGRILALFMRRGFAVAGAGAAIGLLATIIAGRQLQGLLFQVSGTDPVTLAGALALIALGALIAVWWPARAALRTDPMTALRSE